MTEKSSARAETRAEQLRELRSAVGDLVGALRREQRYLDAVPELEAYAANVRSVEESGFGQASVNELAYAVPRLFWLHKEWEPPYERDESGQVHEPAWFQRLSPLERRMQDLAFALRVVGEYGD